jgi:putative secretion ATPase (PEP-CTERM system associated)
MYESHFGFSGPPFQLNPDPAFYFDSRGHANALAYLRFGVHQGEGFIVVTGDIGAGKTTLVKTLLAGLNADQVVAAQIVSTQLEAGDLLHSIITAFGIVPSGQSKAHLIATIEAFLTALATTGRRALLIVDEAQNLNQQAIEEMRMLSNFMLGSHALLQSFLVGQPDLRRLLGSPAMEQFRQRVIASCHLGPLEPPETRAYIEHRLRRVGWQDAPHFNDDSFNEIHRWSGGVPRRVNLLCNRLLLATYLGNGHEITRAHVEQVARELRAEVSEATVVPHTPAVSTTMPSVRDETPKAPPAISTEGSAPPVRRSRADAGRLHDPLLCVVDSPMAYAKAIALASRLAEHSELPPMAVVTPGAATGVALDAELLRCLVPPALEIHLNVGAGRYAKVVAQLAPRFDELLDELHPSAVLSFGSSDPAMTCALVAHKRGVPLIRLEAGRHYDTPSGMLNAALLDGCADVLYSTDLSAPPLAGAEQVSGIGNAVNVMLQVLLPYAGSPDKVLERLGVAAASRPGDRAFALATLQLEPQDSERERHESVSLLCELAASMPTIWLASRQSTALVDVFGLQQRLRDAGVVVVSKGSYLPSIGLLAKAACIVADDDGRLLEEAAALGVRSVVLRSERGSSSADEMASSVTTHSAGAAAHIVRQVVAAEHERAFERRLDDGTAERIATHLRGWLARRAHVGERSFVAPG